MANRLSMIIDFDFFKIENKLKPGAGKVLVSEPFLAGDYFNRSVVLLTQHSDEEGTVGFILNKPTGIKVGKIIPRFPDFDSPAFLGGPVGQDKLFFLHTLGDKIQGSISIKENLYWSGDFDHLLSLIRAGVVDEESVRFFLGYSGWSRGQLDDEIAGHSWIVIDPSVENIMESDENFWLECVEDIGGNGLKWKNVPEHPELN